MFNLWVGWLGIVATAAVVHAASFPSKCPTASTGPIGCYCTYGCSINGDKEFPWTPAAWPPSSIEAQRMREDTICAKITFPLAFQLTQSTALAKYLGARSETNPDFVTTAIPDQTELTVYTSFSQEECAGFLELATQLAAAEPETKKLFIDMCTTDLCNAVDDRPLPASKEDAIASRLPGQCVAASEKDMGCYCTNRCSINRDFVEFIWEPNVWPPRKEEAKYVGEDTICATVTLPIVDTPAARSLAEFVGISGNVSRQNQNYAGPQTGSEVTVYTAFTAAECAEFRRRAEALAADTPAASKVLIFLCNKPWCNSVGAISVAGDITIYLLVVVVILVVVAGLLLWRMKSKSGATDKPAAPEPEPQPANKV